MRTRRPTIILLDTGEAVYQGRPKKYRRKERKSKPSVEGRVSKLREGIEKTTRQGNKNPQPTTRARWAGGLKRQKRREGWKGGGWGRTQKGAIGGVKSNGIT